MNQNTNKTRLVRILVVGAGALVWLLWRWGPTPPAPSHVAVARDIVALNTAPLTATLPSTQARAAEPAQALDTKPRDPREAPVIYEVSVDKQAVCRGEENFVNVHAAGPDGSDTQLRVSLQGTSATGSRIPFRLYGGPAETLPRVFVEGRGGTEVTAELPKVEVKDCEVEQTAAIELSALAASTDEWRFTGRVTSGAFKAESYAWDFGDGDHLVAAEPTVVHSYRFRPQDKRYSSFLIALTMRDASGKLLRTSRAFGFSNPAFGRLMRHGEVAVFSQRLDAQGGQEVVRLYHAYHAPVRIERVGLKIRAQDGRSEAFVGDYTAQESIGLLALLPGEPAEVRLALANMNLPSTRPLLLVFEVSGSTTDGVPASGVFSTQLL